MESIEHARHTANNCVFKFPWMTTAIANSCKQKNLLYKKLRKGLTTEYEYRAFYS